MGTWDQLVGFAGGQSNLRLDDQAPDGVRRPGEKGCDWVRVGEQS